LYTSERNGCVAGDMNGHAGSNSKEYVEKLMNEENE